MQNYLENSFLKSSVNWKKGLKGHDLYRHIPLI